MLEATEGGGYRIPAKMTDVVSILFGLPSSFPEYHHPGEEEEARPSFLFLFISGYYVLLCVGGSTAWTLDWCRYKYDPGRGGAKLVHRGTAQGEE